MVELQLPIGMLGTPAPTFQHFNDKKIPTKNKKSHNISLNKITTKTTSIMKPKSKIGIKSIFENQAKSIGDILLKIVLWLFSYVLGLVL